MDTPTTNNANRSSQGYVFGDGFLNIAKKSPKTPAQRAREYRARKKKRLAQHKGLDENPSRVPAGNDPGSQPPANKTLLKSNEHNLHDFEVEKNSNYLKLPTGEGELSKVHTNHPKDQLEYPAKRPYCESLSGSQTDSDLSNSSIHIKEETTEGNKQSSPRLGIPDRTEDSLVKSSPLVFDEDDDVLFFKSLLPHVKKIPDARKLIFRSRVQDLKKPAKGKARREKTSSSTNDSAIDSFRNKFQHFLEDATIVKRKYK